MRQRALDLAAAIVADPPAAHAGERGRRALRPSCAGWPTTTSPSSATASTPLTGPTARRAARRAGHRLGMLRNDPTGPTARRSAARSRARQARANPGCCMITKANTRSTVHRPVHLDYVGVSSYDATGNVVGGVAVPRPVHLLRLHRVGPADPDHARQGARESCAARASPTIALRQGPRSRSSSPTPATSSSRRQRGALSDIATAVLPLQERRPAAALPPRRRLRPVRLLPGLPPARPLQHRRPAADGRGPPSRVRWLVRRLHDPGLRECPLPAAFRRPYAARHADPRPHRRAGGSPRAPARRRRPHVGREAAGRRPRHLRRGPGRPAAAAVRQGLPHGIQGGFGMASTLAVSPTSRPSPPTWTTPSGTAADALHGGQPRNGMRRFKLFRRSPIVAHQGAARLHPPRRGGRRRAALRGHPRRRHPAARLRLRPAGGLREHLGRGSRTRMREPLRGRLRRGVGRPGRVRRLQRARAGRRAELASGRLLRAVAKYLRQTRGTFSQDYLESTLVANGEIARLLVELWETRFDPARMPERRAVA